MSLCCFLTWGVYTNKTHRRSWIHPVPNLCIQVWEWSSEAIPSMPVSRGPMGGCFCIVEVVSLLGWSVESPARESPAEASLQHHLPSRPVQCMKVRSKSGLFAATLAVLPMMGFGFEAGFPAESLNREP
uniref:Uncharacterized protein n=1 Tax=Sphaerodactylus townsendi TaxID=933632 RepID=A0ACB8EDB4_9SAUR